MKASYAERSGYCFCSATYAEPSGYCFLSCPCVFVSVCPRKSWKIIIDHSHSQDFRCRGALYFCLKIWWLLIVIVLNAGYPCTLTIPTFPPSEKCLLEFDSSLSRGAFTTYPSKLSPQNLYLLAMGVHLHTYIHTYIQINLYSAKIV